MHAETTLGRWPRHCSDEAPHWLRNAAAKQGLVVVWPVTQQSFNILSDGFRKKASGTSLVDSVAAAEQQIMAVFKNKGLSLRKGTA
ncbi:hypothetical protein [Pseudarthrobacter sp. Y6]|uniref:hypothetical protein n=1 Tax=Pseudarthrobacter sp. Y6 TaxID=3418422 RepID=UPI003CF9517D